MSLGCVSNASRWERSTGVAVSIPVSEGQNFWDLHNGATTTPLSWSLWILRRTLHKRLKGGKQYMTSLLHDIANALMALACGSG